MKTTHLTCLIVALLIGSTSQNALWAQQNKEIEPSIRAKAYGNNNIQEENTPWMRIIYRSIDLTQVENMPLHYPEEAIEGEDNLFRTILKLIAENKVSAYEYLDGREVFTPQYLLNTKEMLDRFHILYKEKEGRTSKNKQFIIDESDIPANEVLSYYIKEKYIFNPRTSNVEVNIEALCPILHRTGDFGGDAMKYPMFWIPLNEIAPYLSTKYIMTSNTNNVKNNTLADYLNKRAYKGEIYKAAGLSNQSLIQQYPTDSALTAARAKIEKELLSIDESAWVKREPTETNVKEKTNKRREAEETVATKPAKEKSPARTRTTRAPKEKKSSGSSNNSQAPVRSVRRSK